uniref:S-phase kinase-associated protein 2 n=2 Tax=Nothobranchius TaxID=28779 RepID=A0A8C6NIG4_NOTFU
DSKEHVFVLPISDNYVDGLLTLGRILRNKRSRTCLAEGPDSECTPTESIQQRPPPLKVPLLLPRGKENEFVLARRSRRRKSVSLDHLPEELLLRIYSCLPLHDLLRISGVSRRWQRLASDESLWYSVDLEGLTHVGPALQQVLRTGVRRLRCPRPGLGSGPSSSPLQIVELDLSSSIIPTSTLQNILGRCRLLHHLSLEGLQLSNSIIRSDLYRNSNLLQLNLSGCSGFSSAALTELLQSCCRLEQLNVSWCSFSSDHVKSVVGHLSPTVSALNLSGYRESLTLDDVKVLVDRCPHIQTLDLSDGTLLTANSFPVLRQLRKLLHLSLSRCYHIHLAALSDLEKLIPSLRFLDIFGLVQENQLLSLKEELPHISINSRPFSAVARPTPASRPDRSMWGRTCRLRAGP